MAQAKWQSSVSSAPWVTMDVNQSSQNVGNNTSTVSWNLVIHRPYSIGSSASKSWWISIDGQESSGTTTIGGSGDKTIASGQKTISHNADGTKQIGFSFNLQMDIDWSGYGHIGTVSANGALALSTIPRASVITGVSGDQIGSQVTLTVTKYYDGFHHNLIYRRFDGVEFNCGDFSGNPYFTPDINDCGYLPNNTSAAVLLKVVTYNGGTWIGESSVWHTLNVPSWVVPNASVSITGGDLNGHFYRLLTRFEISASDSGVYGSTITNRKIEANGQTFNSGSATTNYFATDGSKTVSYTVTDSRGRSRTVTTSGFVNSYDLPAISSFGVIRSDSSGNYNDQGTYMRVTVNSSVYAPVGSGQDAYAEILIQTAPVGSSDWTTKFDSNINNPSSISISPTVSSYDTNLSYQVRIVVRDMFNQTTTVYDALPTGFTLINFRSTGRGIAFGKVSEGDDLEIGMTAKDKNGNEIIGLGGTNSENILRNTTVKLGEGTLVRKSIDSVTYSHSVNGSPWLGLFDVGGAGLSPETSYLAVIVVLNSSGEQIDSVTMPIATDANNLMVSTLVNTSTGYIRVEPDGRQWMQMWSGQSVTCRVKII